MLINVPDQRSTSLSTALWICKSLDSDTETDYLLGFFQMYIFGWAQYDLTLKLIKPRLFLYSIYVLAQEFVWAFGANSVKHFSHPKKFFYPPLSGSVKSDQIENRPSRKLSLRAKWPIEEQNQIHSANSSEKTPPAP